jgi:dolichol-phosphate mannosyltransferase
MVIMQTLAILATYNEADNIEELIAEILKRSPDIDVLVIDDNSPDGTGRIAEELAARERRVSVIHRREKLGLASATIAGFRFAFEKGYEYALVMDADFSHHPRYIPAILEEAAASGADIVIGSRYVVGGGIEGWRLARRLSSRAVNIFSRWMLGIRARDSSGAYRLYRLSKLREIDFGNMISAGYSYLEELLLRCQRNGFVVKEVPIVFADRETGSSKLTTREIARSMCALFKLAFLSRLGKL